MIYRHAQEYGAISSPASRWVDSYYLNSVEVKHLRSSRVLCPLLLQLETQEAFAVEKYIQSYASVCHVINGINTYLSMAFKQIIVGS